MVLVISALLVVACTPQETSQAQQDQVQETPDDVVADTASDEFVAEDDFVEIGEMI